MSVATPAFDNHAAQAFFLQVQEFMKKEATDSLQKEHKKEVDSVIETHRKVVEQNKQLFAQLQRERGYLDPQSGEYLELQKIAR